MKLGALALLAFSLSLVGTSANAVNAGVSGCHGAGPNVDCDYWVDLDTQEVNTLSSPATRAAVAARVATLAPPATAILAVYIDQRIQQVQSHAGPNGAHIQITTRLPLGPNPHLFDVFGR
jgi:hypothetical protein